MTETTGGGSALLRRGRYCRKQLSLLPLDHAIHTSYHLCCLCHTPSALWSLCTHACTHTHRHIREHVREHRHTHNDTHAGTHTTTHTRRHTHNDTHTQAHTLHTLPFLCGIHQTCSFLVIPASTRTHCQVAMTMPCTKCFKYALH